MTEPINLSELLRAMKDAGISGSGSFTVVELCEAGGIGTESARTLIKRALKAVSYTHLDVYKRQVYGR